MLRGLYTSASGMLVEALKTDAVANNLANAQTTGFKRQNMSVRSFPEMLLSRINDAPFGSKADPRPVIGWLGTGAAAEDFALDMTPGSMAFTGRSLDLGLDGPGFFAVETVGGGVAFTRDGGAHVDAQGYLAGPGGFRYLGEAGPIHVGAGEPLVDSEGQVWLNGQPVDRLVLVEFPLPQALERLGENLLAANDASGPPVPSEATTVHREYLERSNVNVVREMVSMITIQRAYEANQRMLQVQDETLGRLINDAASLA